MTWTAEERNIAYAAVQLSRDCETYPKQAYVLRGGRCVEITVKELGIAYAIDAIGWSQVATSVYDNSPEPLREIVV